MHGKGRYELSKAMRIAQSRGGLRSVRLLVDDGIVRAYEGESLAAALLAAGIDSFRRTASGAARGPYCNMGVCFDCVVTVEGMGAVRACSTPVTDGMQVRIDGR